jgi:hypothetical protein
VLGPPALQKEAPAQLLRGPALRREHPDRTVVHAERLRRVREFAAARLVDDRADAQAEPLDQLERDHGRPLPVQDQVEPPLTATARDDGRHGPGQRRGRLAVVTPAPPALPSRCCHIAPSAERTPPNAERARRPIGRRARRARLTLLLARRVLGDAVMPSTPFTFSSTVGHERRVVLEEHLGVLAPLPDALAW